MSIVSIVVLLCSLTATVQAQLNSVGPGYYRNGRERFDSYMHRTYTDPGRLGWLLLDSAKDNWSQDPDQWDQSAESYSYRVASGWGRRMVRNTAQSGLETFLHQDSRYRRSLEHGLRRRMFLAIRNSMIAYKPDGWVAPAYGLVAAGVIAAAVSSTWHPQSVGADAFFWGIGQSAIDRAANNLLTEFEPELRRFGQKTRNQIFRK